MDTLEQKHEITQQYRNRTAHSRMHFEEASRFIPAGATRSLNSWAPYPLYVSKGCGPVVYDIDSNEYIDFLNNYTASILGHAHPIVTAAVAKQLANGFSFAFATELELSLACLLGERIPSIERIRFTGSGTEAAMFALRLARAFTGRSMIAKMEGGYHGTYDGVSISVRPALAEAGSVQRPVALPETKGLVPGVVEDVLILPFNHFAETKALIEEHADQLAALIVEPILGVGGMVVPEAGYLALLRELCTQHGIVLIFDEVITLRLAPGGAQEYYQVLPDLTTMGKIIGGGFPVGAVAGTAAIMSLLEPRGGHDVYDPRAGGPPVYQGGTFTGNPLTLAAGLATLQELTSNVYEHLNKLGDQLRARLTILSQELDAPITVTGAGSLFNIHFLAGPITDFRATRAADAIKQQEFFLGLLNEGLMIAPRGMGCISVPMTDAHIDQFIQGTRRVLLRMQKR